MTIAIILLRKKLEFILYFFVFIISFRAFATSNDKILIFNLNSYQELGLPADGRGVTPDLVDLHFHKNVLFILFQKEQDASQSFLKKLIQLRNVRETLLSRLGDSKEPSYRTALREKANFYFEQMVLLSSHTNNGTDLFATVDAQQWQSLMKIVKEEFLRLFAFIPSLQDRNNPSAWVRFKEELIIYGRTFASSIDYYGNSLKRDGVSMPSNDDATSINKQIRSAAGAIVLSLLSDQFFFSASVEAIEIDQMTRDLIEKGFYVGDSTEIAGKAFPMLLFLESFFLQKRDSLPAIVGNERYSSYSQAIQRYLKLKYEGIDKGHYGHLKFLEDGWIKDFMLEAIVNRWKIKHPHFLPNDSRFMEKIYLSTLQQFQKERISRIIQKGTEELRARYSRPVGDNKCQSLISGPVSEPVDKNK